MENENEKNLGFCHFCGQSQIIETVGDVTQEERDQLATNKCMCPEAQSDRRKRERKAKIEAYINKHFSDRVGNYVRASIDIIESFDVDKVSFNFDSKTCTIWLDSDSWLHLKIQHREDDELKV